MGERGGCIEMMERVSVTSVSITDEMTPASPLNTPPFAAVDRPDGPELNALLSRVYLSRVCGSQSLSRLTC